MFGGETLYQLRSALQLAEIEREGVSTVQTQSRSSKGYTVSQLLKRGRGYVCVHL